MRLLLTSTEIKILADKYLVYTEKLGWLNKIFYLYMNKQFFFGWLNKFSVDATTRKQKI